MEVHPHDRRAMGILLLVVLSTVIGVSADNSNLFAKLTSDYDSNMRPVCNGVNTPVNVTMDMGLRQLIDLNEPVQLLQLSVWVRLYWNDCRLKWNETDFEGKTSLVMSENHVWTPDIEVYDGISDDFRRDREFRVAVSSSGNVKFLFQAVIDARCTVDVTSFPFDDQHCPLSFGSWAYHGHDLDVQPIRKTGDLAHMVQNVEWDVVGFSAKKETKYFVCCVEPYPFITYTLHMKRKPNFYVINLILPSIFVMALTMMVFFIPADSGEKVSFAVTLMLALAVFQLMLADALPPSAETVPIIAGYFAVSEGLVGFVCMAAIIVLNIHSRGNKNMSNWIRRIFLGRLAHFVCVTTRNDGITSGPLQQEETAKAHGYPTKLANDWKSVATVIERITALLFIPSLLLTSLYVFVNLVG